MMKPVVLACVIGLGLSTAACDRFGPGPRNTQLSSTQRCEGLSGTAFEQCRRDAGYTGSRSSSSYRSGGPNAPTTDDPAVLRGTGGSEQQGAR